MKISLERQHAISRCIAAGYEKSQIIQNVDEDQFWDIKFASYAAAEDTSTPGFILNELAGDPVANLRWRVARNASTPIEVLNVLVGDNDDVVAGFALDNPAFSLESHLELLKKGNFKAGLRVKLFLANDSQTPVEVLSMLAQQSESSVREAVAVNPQTPVEVLSMLAQQSESSVRAAVAVNPQTPVEVLSMLAQQSESSVREAVARNPSINQSTVFALIRYENIEILEALLENVKITSDVFRDLRFKISQQRRNHSTRISNPNVHERRHDQF